MKIPEEYILVSLCLLLLAVSILIDAFVRWKRSSPEIVVYLDKDAKRPATLPLPDGKIVTGERAALWWTVFEKAIETEDSDDATYAANEAVETVFGK